ncbi:MAG TPA: extracellular solute-binding protein [Ilumatobacteraceae bacterium]|jgi:alpha-glucoside transport system substrate-binding protein|nr:extracellular solute-binding protein [Ilumatobacteraceae bacterium]
MKRRLAGLAGVAGVVAVVALIASCSGSSSDGDTDAVTVFGPWVGADADAMADVLDGFDGAEVRYTGSGDFVTDFDVRIGSGLDRPDVALVPQPAIIDELIASGDLVPFSDEVASAVADGFAPGSWDRTEDGFVYVLPYRSNVKSLVWYRPEVFAANGWAVPASMDELEALVTEIQSGSVIVPWCFSIFAGGETGWPATDWIEDLVLRESGPEVYDQWVDGEIDFSDPRIQRVFETFDRLVLAQGRVLGGRSDVLEVEVARAGDGLFTTEPGCAMFKQASFATTWFPDGTSISPGGDVDFFILPDEEPDATPPLLVAGTGAVQLSARPEVDEMMAYLASPEGADAWASRGGYVSARTDVDPDRYYRGVDARFSALLQNAPVTRFDASDQFDSTLREAVLDGITAWIAGRVTLDELLASLDEVAAG